MTFRANNICKYGRSLPICSNIKGISDKSNHKDNEPNMGDDDSERVMDLLNSYADQSTGLFNKVYQARVAFKNMFDNEGQNNSALKEERFRLVMPLKAYFYGFSETSVDVLLKRAILWNPSPGNQLIEECMFIFTYIHGQILKSSDHYVITYSG